MKKIIAVNDSPRPSCNTGQLVREAARGANDAGAEVVVVDLYKLDSFTGCLSCFACKRDISFGRCILQDGLTKLLQDIREADGLILGSPNYLSELTSGFRALYERLIFQSYTYVSEKPCSNEKKIPVLLITTSNRSLDEYETRGYDRMLEENVKFLNSQIGPTKLFVCDDTLQVKDYSIYNWNYFEPELKKKRHEEEFPHSLKEVYLLGKELL